MVRIMNDNAYRAAVARHYDTLLAGGDDPVLDPPELQAYMAQWDGQPFLDLLKLDGSLSVLEIGVGTGRLAVQTVPMCGSYTGIDLAPDTLLRARHHLQAYDHVELICGDFMTHSFKEQFDVVYSSLTWMHIRDKMHAAQRVAAVLKPGGRFVLCIERENRKEIDAGTTSIGVYPDDPAYTAECLRSAGLCPANIVQTPLGLICAAVRK